MQTHTGARPSDQRREGKMGERNADTYIYRCAPIRPKKNHSTYAVVIAFGTSRG